MAICSHVHRLQVFTRHNDEEKSFHMHGSQQDMAELGCSGLAFNLNKLGPFRWTWNDTQTTMLIASS